MKLLKVSYKQLYVDPYFMLAKLEFDYCLPKWFWSDKEWSRYTQQRIALLRLKNEMESVKYDR